MIEDLKYLSLVVALFFRSPSVNCSSCLIGSYMQEHLFGVCWEVGSSRECDQCRSGLATQRHAERKTFISIGSTHFGFVVIPTLRAQTDNIEFWLFSAIMEAYDLGRWII